MAEPSCSYVIRNEAYSLAEDMVAGSGSGGGSGNGGARRFGGGGGGDDSSDKPSGTGLAALLTMLLAGLMVGGGGMGYVKKGSKMSAIAGGSIGAGLVAASLLMMNASHFALGLRLATGLCAFTAVGMFMRAKKSGALSSGKMGPTTGVLALSSIYTVGLIAAFHSAML